MSKKKKIVLGIIVVVIIIVAGVIIWRFLYPQAQEPADERFGFLGGPMLGEYKIIRQIGAGWVRPHPGPFIWGKMQKSAQDQIDFQKTDDLVKKAAKYDLKLLITLWPYAEWDQKNHSPEKKCKISGDEFSREFGNYRCNPYNWQAYEKWVKAVVERYDADGLDDMPGLKQPVKYWEVFNEPDLQGAPGLQFYVEEPEDYGELLKHTAQQIRQADTEAKILIAGAAGGNDDFLNFYRQLFSDENISDYFDIANVHCISNDDYESFNVKLYGQMLAEFNINKPIWVTEGETFITDDPLINATQLKASTQEALKLSAEKIFYTSAHFDRPPGEKPPPSHSKIQITPDPLFKNKSSEEIYKLIFKSL